MQDEQRGRKHRRSTVPFDEFITVDPVSGLATSQADRGQFRSTKSASPKRRRRHGGAAILPLLSSQRLETMQAATMNKTRLGVGAYEEIPCRSFRPTVSRASA